VSVCAYLWVSEIVFYKRENTRWISSVVATFLMELAVIAGSVSDRSGISLSKSSHSPRHNLTTFLSSTFVFIATPVAIGLWAVVSISCCDNRPLPVRFAVG
jgi:hypothetical protein